MGPNNAIIFFILAVILYVISGVYFSGKGIIFNLSYIMTKKEERAKMDRKPFLRQTAVIFLLLGTVFFLEGLAALLANFWLGALAAALLVATIVFIAFKSAKNC